ncbi:hypothetical protein [Pedobacter sp. L105]|uniref:hypothetical protein n=1 Tax=Pedobacter sp. L105 TaxID=1641871 RepID=UPI00131D1132|nr:hypothetical protein [Pedobacter sp. L105]
MRYLAININYKLDQDWYHRCGSVLECYKYFERLGPGDGGKAAIYDTEINKYLWIDEKQFDNDDRLNKIVVEAVNKIKTNLK